MNGIAILVSFLAYLDSHIHAKINEELLQGEVLSFNLYKNKPMAVEYMNKYISQ